VRQRHPLAAERSDSGGAQIGGRVDADELRALDEGVEERRDLIATPLKPRADAMDPHGKERLRLDELAPDVRPAVREDEALDVPGPFDADAPPPPAVREVSS